MKIYSLLRGSIAVASVLLFGIIIFAGETLSAAAEDEVLATYRQFLPLSFGENCIPRPYITPNDPGIDLAVEKEINKVRANNGLPMLKHSDQIAQAALRHSKDLAENNFVIGHTGTDGSDPIQRLDEACYRWLTIGEVVAGGFDGKPEKVIDAWMNSPGHRYNILFTQFTELGSGYVYKSRTKYKHYFTVNFGLPDTSSKEISREFNSCRYYLEDGSGEIWLNLYSVWPCDQLWENPNGTFEMAEN